MSLIRWTPMSSMLSRWPEVWDEDIMPTLNSAFSQNLDVFETENEVVVRANVAGVAEKDVDITFEKGILWIKAEREVEKDDEKKKHYSKSAWSYSYKISVPGLIDFAQEPSAVIRDGVVTITFKKAEESKPRKLQVKKAS